MTSWFKNNVSTVFTSFLVSVIITFFLVRPLNSPWHPFIAGDGLGYYSYLPAQFIYNDKDYSFYWFNRVHNENYSYSAFENPEDNLLVKHGYRKINKYYQGLSFVWMPFFFVAHYIAKVSGYAADGFSLPYQWAIGFASLLYLLIGLQYLRKLLLKLFQNELASVVVPAVIFYGTHLFTYAISANSLSHSYSFTFIVLFLYYLQCFAQDDERRTRNFLLAALFLAISISIRPLTGLIVLLIPVFIREWRIFKELKFYGLQRRDYLLLGLIVAVVAYVARINYIQTGSVFSYTYSDERFYFDRPEFFNALFSFHNGLFVYVPCVLVSLGGIPFLNRRMRFTIPLFFFGVVFLYSCWWFWPITKRALVDFYVLPAIMLGALLNSDKAGKWILALFAVCVIYFQFKSWQMSKGILDEYATYAEVFWRNFFRIEKANMYLIPPSTVLDKEEHFEDFENLVNDNVSTAKKYSGEKSFLINGKYYIADMVKNDYPLLFRSKDFKKVRLSFRCYFTEEVEQTHVFFRFFNKENQEVISVPFYLNEEDIIRGKWDFKAFGYEIADTALINNRKVDKVVFTLWNVNGKGEIYVDDVKTEYVLTNKSFETINK